MLRRVPKALKVGFRAGFNSFVTTLKPPRRLIAKNFHGSVRPKKKDLIVGDIWLEVGNGRAYWGATRTWVWDGRDFVPILSEVDPTA